MKKVLALFALFATTAVLCGYGTSNYMQTGGARWVIGGSADVASGGEIDIESGGALKIAGTAITASAAELNVNDGVTAGTVTASKVVVVDASKDISAFRNVTLTNLDAGASGTAGTIDVFPTTASKGKLAITCQDQTGDTTVTLDVDAMGQATTVNIADPGAAASYIAQSTAALTLAEVDVLDAVTAGTAAASKAVVLDGSKDVTGLNSVGLAELKTTGNVGVASLGVTAVEYGDQTTHKTVLTVAEFTQAIAGAALGFGKSIYTFPEGFVKVDYATIDLTIYAATETGTPDVGIGSVVASGAIDVLSGTATFEDIMDGFTATAITTDPGSVSNNYVAAEAGSFDGHTAAEEIFLNFAETWTATEDLYIAGTVTLYWTYFGDY